MAYLQKSDLFSFIKDEILDQVTQNDDTKIDTAIKIAESEASAYLSHRYNLVTEFAKAGDARNFFLVAIIARIAIYHVYSRVNPVQIPLTRRFEYNGNYEETGEYGGALRNLKDVQEGFLTLEIDKKSPSDTRRPLEIGSNTKYSSNF